MISGWVTFLICTIALAIIAAGGILLIVGLGVGAAPKDDDKA